MQQPWAWAIVHGGKDVENRTQAWGYRGPLAIHAGVRLSERGVMSPLITGALQGNRNQHGPYSPWIGGVVIGVVDLHGVHESVVVDGRAECCDSEWGEWSYDEHGGRTRRDVVHLVLADPRPLRVPIPAKGRLGLWTPDADLVAAIREQLPA